MVARRSSESSIFKRVGRWIYHEPAIVLFDGSCRLCRGTIALLRSSDILGQLIPVDALNETARSEAGVDHLETSDLLDAMHVVVGDQTWSGFAACRVLAGRVPLFWPIWPLLYLWPVPAVGRRMYRHVANRRSCSTGEMPFK